MKSGYAFLVVFGLMFSLQRESFAQRDDAYRVIVDSLASPVYTKAEDARSAHADAQVMLRAEMARQRLKQLTSLPEDLSTVARHALEPLERCNVSLQNQRRLDNSTPDIQGVAFSALKASPGLYKVYKKESDTLTTNEGQALANLALKAGEELFTSISNSFEAAEERKRYVASYRTMRATAVNDLIGIVDKRYADVAWSETSTISVDLNGSINGFRNSDWLFLTNSGASDLTNCTVVVVIKGSQNGQDASDRHVHFIPSWPKGEWILAPYASTSLQGIASNESVDAIFSLKIFILSDQRSEVVDYKYIGAEYDADLERYVKDVAPKFYGSWYRYDTNYFTNDGLSWSFEGQGSLPASKITVRATRGGQSVGLYSNVTESLRSSKDNYFSDERFNGISPQDVELIVHFPFSDFKHEVKWEGITIRK